MSDRAPSNEARALSGPGCTFQPECKSNPALQNFHHWCADCQELTLAFDAFAVEAIRVFVSRADGPPNRCRCCDTNDWEFRPAAWACRMCNARPTEDDS